MAPTPHVRVSRETPDTVAGVLSVLGEGVTEAPSVATERLSSYAVLLRTVATQRGFIAPKDADRLLERHVLDGVRACCAIPASARDVVDVGSGAGIPGIPFAIARPDADVHLVEPRAARAAFLDLAVEHLGLTNVRVHATAVERLDVGAAQVAVARAFAPLERAWDAIRGILAPDGRLVFFAGASVQAPQELPGAADITEATQPTWPEGVLASAGPLIIITRSG